MMTRNILGLIGAVMGVTGIGLLTGVAGSDAVGGWYEQLRHPFFAPPTWVFAPVWTVLYVMIGIAAWRVWSLGQLTHSRLFWFVVQLVLNYGWTLIFFNAHLIDWAFIDILALIAAVLLMMDHFREVSRLAFWLLVPYLLWISFAALLNLVYWILNA